MGNYTVVGERIKIFAGEWADCWELTQDFEWSPWLWANSDCRHHKQEDIMWLLVAIIFQSALIRLIGETRVLS